MKKDILLFRMSIVMLFVSSFAILLSFVGDYNGSFLNIIFALLTGILFWIGLILGYVFLAVVNSHRKRFEKKNGIDGNTNKVGAVTFFRNKPAILFDILFIVSLISTLIFMFVPFLDKGIALILLSVCLFSLHMHCILNGKNYLYYKTIKRNIKERTRKR